MFRKALAACREQPEFDHRDHESLAAHQLGIILLDRKEVQEAECRERDACLTMNAMALIAPGAFLWLTFQIQSLYGAPMAGCAMWFGIVLALLLCLATAISYAELSKIFPGAGSSYLYAEQAFLSKTKAYKFARIIKFFTGWASHLYYWVYPGCMVGVTAILGGFLLNQFWPDTFSGTYNSPLFMYVFCFLFAFGVAYIAYRGVTGTTAVNVAINVIQITALTVFAVIAIAYRTGHKQDSVGWHLSNGTAITYQVDTTNVLDDKGKPVQDAWADTPPTPKVDDKGQPIYKTQDRVVTKDDLANKDIPLPAGIAEGDPYPVLEKDAAGKLVIKDGHAVAVPFTVSYKPDEAITGAGTDKDPTTFNFHATAASVVSPHGFNFMFIQACIAILILVGFESVTAMGEEARAFGLRDWDREYKRILYARHKSPARPRKATPLLSPSSSRPQGWTPTRRTM